MNGKIKKVLSGKNGNYIFPFFWQHGEDEATLREYMRAIDESNIKGVCVESRPHPDFCGERWWHDMDIILDEARKRKMKVWILDDSHFPTGFANGAMKDQPDELCRQSICCRKYDMKEGESLHLDEAELYHPAEFKKNMVEEFVLPKEQRVFHDDRLLAVSAYRQDSIENGSAEKRYRIDLMPFVSDDNTLTWTAPAGEWKVCVLHLSRNYGYHRDYINMMDHDSCRVLIDAVYEPHYAHYKDDFGKTIAGFFSDEPELGNGHLYEIENGFGTDTDFPWSRELEERLKKELGPDYGMKLALLWDASPDSEETAKVRYTYMNAVTDLVKKDFSQQIGKWCRIHGVEYIGHLIEDDNHHTRTGSSLGHYFRGLAGQDMARIDDIGGQVFPRGEDINYNNGIFQHRNGTFYHYMLGKLGSSAAAIESGKRGRSMCEIFGNYGWSEGVRLEKYLTDHFLVRGINHFVPHAFSATEYPDPDCPPHFYAHGNNPQYRHFGCLMAYMNRMCELLNGGSHIAPVAVLYHAEAEWMGKYMTSDQIGRVLADHQIEYDYIPQDVFTDRSYFQTKIRENILQVNSQRYHTLIIPYAQYMTDAMAKAVVEMTGKGIRVILINDYPEAICNVSVPDKEKIQEYKTKIYKLCPAVKLEDLAELLEQEDVRELSLEPQNDRVRYLHYIHPDGTSVWMFVNEGRESYNGIIRFRNDPEKDDTVFYEYDPWDNQIFPAEQRDGKISIDIEPLKSCVFISDPSAEKEEIEKLYRERTVLPKERKEIPFTDPWRRSLCRSIEYPNFREEKQVSLPDSLAKEKPEFSGFVKYTNHFYTDLPGKVYLEITDAAEGVEVFLNGKSLGIQIAPPFLYYLTDQVRSGENEICIEVATTLERENAGVSDVTGQIKEPESQSGITGSVNLFSEY